MKKWVVFFCCYFQDNVVANKSAVISNIAIVQGSNFSENSATNGGSAINLVSNARYDQATKSAWILDWWVKLCRPSVNHVLLKWLSTFQPFQQECSWHQECPLESAPPHNFAWAEYLQEKHRWSNNSTSGSAQHHGTNSVWRECC